jgi:hypothetical protein
MALETPIWLQGGTYSARLDRSLLDVIFSEGVVDPGAGALLASQRAAGANDSVDVAAGAAIIAGDDEADQGKYYVRNTAVSNVVFTPAPGADSRIDLLVLQVNDPTAGGAAGDDATFEVIAGTPAGSPVAPAVPDTAIPIAQVLRTALDTSITDAMITDVRDEAVLVVPAAVSSLANIGDVDLAGLADGDVIRYDSASGDWLPGFAVNAFNTVTATTTTTVTVSTQTYTDSTLTATITPSSTSSKILICVIQPVRLTNSFVAAFAAWRIMRDSTEIARPANNAFAGIGIEAAGDGVDSVAIRLVLSATFLDAPNTTSPVVYKTQGAPASAFGTLTFHPTTNSTAYIALIEIPG